MGYRNSFNSIYVSSEKETQEEIEKSIYKVNKQNSNRVKDYLIKSGKYELWRNINYAKNSWFKACEYGTDMFKKYEIYLGVNLELSPFEIKCCKQIYNAYRQRNKRLKLYIDLAITGYDCVFLTLTFRDSVLNNTSHDTRREYISEYCKGLGGSFYCANIDYGDKDKNVHSKQREHYHALVNLPFIDLSSYKYGYIFSERVRKSSKSDVLAKYINKLTNHAYKDSTKGRDRVIYSRKKFF